jgi:hypothetical protein
VKTTKWNFRPVFGTGERLAFGESVRGLQIEPYFSSTFEQILDLRSCKSYKGCVRVLLSANLEERTIGSNCGVETHVPVSPNRQFSGKAGWTDGRCDGGVVRCSDELFCVSSQVKQRDGCDHNRCRQAL